MARGTGSRNGHFDLFYSKGWAYLTVFPPEEEGTPVYYEEVQNRMRLLGVPRVGFTEIRGIVERASGRPEQLVEWPEGASLASVISVTVSEDAMTAEVEITPPRKGALAPTIGDVVQTLEEHGVVYGVYEDEIARLLAENRYNTKTIAAEGSEPVNARSGEIKYYFDPDRGKPYLQMPFGRINLKELNFIENKKEGELLAELLPPVPPKDGRTVTGVVLPAETETDTVEIPAGENTKLSIEKTSLYATADGNVRIKNGKIIIEPVVTVKNVNYETGNIYFDGSVVVEKDVADGFIIEAGGDIQVGRGVGKARLKAGEHVLLKTGINGHNEGSIECGGNLFAKYIESSEVYCRGNVFVEEAIMHSRLSVWNHCALNGRRSEIIASNIIIGGSLWCKKLGSIYDAPTHVYCGINPDLFTAFRDAKKELETKQERLEEVKDQLAKLSRGGIDLQEKTKEQDTSRPADVTGNGSERQAGNLEEKILQARQMLAKETQELESELPDVLHRMHELREKLVASRKSLVVIEDTMYKGAVVTFGRHEFRAPEKGVRRTVLKAGEDGVKESGFNPHEQPELDFERVQRP
jgi:hypothetical protein